MATSPAPLSPHPEPDIGQFIAALPKAELHVHLEGCVDSDTLWELASAQRSELFAGGRESVERLYRTRSFTGFLDAFKTVCLHLHTADDYELITYRMLRGMAQQNVRYAEVNFSAGVLVWKGQTVEPLFAGAARGARQAERDFGIRARWIFDAVRHLPLEHGWQVARSAAELRGEGVIGIGIGGNEISGPASRFREIFEFARAEGLRVVAHAGEAAGPESIWDALRELKAERIGHGLTAAADRDLIQHLAEQQTPVEVCLTSNWRTGGIAELKQHPIRDFFLSGLQISLHTDDPALFATDINREYKLAHEVFGFTARQLRQLAINSFQAAFLSAAEKQAHLAEFDI